MTKGDDAFDCYCCQAVDDATFEAVLEALEGLDDATFEAVLEALVEEAAATGGFVAMFGPPELFEGLEEEAGGEPRAPARLRGPSGPWWPLR